MNKTQRLMTAVVAALLSSPVLAVTTLDFENIGHQAAVLTYYDGGADSAGNKGPDVGAVFGGNARVFTSGNYDPTKAPSPVGVMTLFASTPGQQVDAVLNIADGFVGALNGWFSAISGSNGHVDVYDQVGGKGTVLGTSNLFNTNGSSCPAGVGSFRCWQSFSISLGSDVGRSVVFSSVQLLSLFDNVQFTPYAPPTAPIPEPGTWALMLAGLAGTGWLARRRSAT